MQGVLAHLVNQMNENTKRTFIANQKRGGSGTVIEEWSQTQSWKRFISQFSKGEQKLQPMTRLRKNILQAILENNPNAKLEVKLEFKDLR
jgi:molybdenum-dependent DNA-binding transcriptional regulator ModE